MRGTWFESDYRAECVSAARSEVLLASSQAGRLPCCRWGALLRFQSGDPFRAAMMTTRTTDEKSSIRVASFNQSVYQPTRNVERKETTPDKQVRRANPMPIPSSSEQHFPATIHHVPAGSDDFVRSILEKYKKWLTWMREIARTCIDF